MYPLLFCSQFNIVRLLFFFTPHFYTNFSLVGCIQTKQRWQQPQRREKKKKTRISFPCVSSFRNHVLVGFYFHSAAAFLCLSNLLWIGHSPSYNQIRVGFFFAFQNIEKSIQKKNAVETKIHLSFTMWNQMPSNRVEKKENMMNWLANNYYFCSFCLSFDMKFPFNYSK